MDCVFIRYTYNNNTYQFLIHKSSIENIHPCYLRMCFHGKKHENIVHLKEWLMLAQVIITNQKMMKLSLERVKEQE